MAQKVFRQVCFCETCGNEAEMTITCSLESDDNRPAATAAESKPETENEKEKTHGHAVCSHCGAEADMWLDI